jgi:hypothetical protein
MQFDAPRRLLPRLRIEATSQAPRKLDPAGKLATAVTGVADGELSSRAAKRKLRCAQITRQKKNGPANRQARSDLELTPDVTDTQERWQAPLQ